MFKIYLTIIGINDLSQQTSATITRLVRHNIFNTPRLLNEWSGNDFEGILKSIKDHLMPVTGIKGLWYFSEEKQLFEMF